MKKILLLTMLILGLSVQAWAYDFVEGGIYYNITGDGTVEVTWGGNSASAGTDEYTGDIVVPSTVTHEGTTYAVTGIGASAFQTNKELLTAYLPSSITSVGEHAFQGCTALTTVTFEENPNPVSFEGTYTFYGCEALESITLPSNMQTIVTQMFRGCSSLEKLEIPETVTSIEDRAFYGTGLKSIVIPDNVTKLGTSSTGTNGGVLRDCTSLEEAVIGDAVTTIEYQLFRGDTSLKKVTFGESCTEIGSNCFYGCSALEEIIMKCPEPPLAAFNSSGYSDGNFFKDVPETCVLYVPAGSKAAYEAANIWNELTIEESPVSYTDWLHLVVNDTDEGVVKSTVTVKYTDSNTIDFTLHDFSVDIYMGAWITVYLGDLTMSGIEVGEMVDGVASISCTNNTNVSFPDADPSYATLIRSVSVNMTGEVSDTKLRANMDITVTIMLFGDYPVTATFGYDYGEYLIVNTETGNYLGGGLDWGTHATEIGKPQFFSYIEQTDGTYTLNGHQGSSTSIGWDEDGTALYIDGAQPLAWELIEADGGYKIATDKGYLTGNGFQTAVTLQSTAGSTAIWKLVTKDEVIATMDDATAESPVDVTPLIPAPEPKNANWGGSWTATGYGVSADPGNFSFGSGWNTANCAESYHSENGFDAHQTFSLPKAGFYTLTAQAFYRNDGSSKVLPSIYVTTGTSATDDSGALTSLPLPVLTTTAGSMEDAYKEFLDEKHPVSITFMIDEEGDEITVGFDSNVAEDNEMWTIFGELGLTYSGDYQPTLTAVEGMMNADVEATQTSALAAYASSPSSATYSAALNAIQAATESMAHYAEITDALESGKYDSVLASFDEAGQAAFENDFMAAYNARTLTDETIEEGLATACKQQVTLGSDMSFALKNSGTWVNAIIELSSNSGASFGLCPQLPTAHEVWSENAWNLGRDVLERKAIYKQIEDLPEGTYILSFYAYGDEAANAETRPLAYANDAEEQEVAYLSALGNAWTSASLYTFECEVGEDGILEFGMKTQGDGHWYVMEEYSLQYGETPFEPTTVSYTDNLHVVLSGEDEGVMKATVDVEYTAADVINFTLHDLAVGDYNVGNVTVTGITLEDDGDGVCTFSYSGSDVTISGGDFDSFIGWVTITIDISGEITEDKLLANMTVDVKMFGASLLSITADFGYNYYEYLVVNAATGNYLGGGLDWGTHATELGKPQFFTFAEQADGTYNINGNQGGTSIGWSELYDGIYIDAVNPLTWTVTESGDGYTFYNDTYGYLTGHGSQTAVTIEKSLSDAAVWKMVTKDEILASMADATLDNPVDVTALIPAPEPKRNNWGGSWTATGYNTSAEPTNYSFGQSGNTANCAESWHSENGFDIHQTIPSLPAGYYVLTAQAFHDGSPSVVPVMYVDDETIEIPVLTTSASDMESAYQEFLEKKHTTEGIGFTVEADGTDVLVGFSSLLQDNNGIWTIFGELELLYYGPDAPEDHSYQFVAEDWVASDNGRAPQSSITYNSDNTITVVADGQNNIALGNNTSASWYPAPEPNVITTANYTITEDQCYFVVIGSDLSTDTTVDANGNCDCYMWWMNGWNEGSQVPPTEVYVLDDEQVMFVWDISSYVTADADGVITLDGGTCFGLTSTADDHSATISDINFYTKEEVIATGISSVKEETETAVEGIYDMAGRKVSKAVKGVYIINGKKVLVK